MPRTWRFLAHDPSRVQHLSSHLRVSPLVAQVLIARGLGETATEFLNPRLTGLHDPEMLPGIADAADRVDYQTMFAARDGAVAAPTAGLHFTLALMQALAAAGIGHETLTLHVGAGTFLPVKAEDTADHAMHAEWGRIDQATADRLNAARAAGGRLIAVGTTCLRLLESDTTLPEVEHASHGASDAVAQIIH